jgi:hypothetical protein
MGEYKERAQAERWFKKRKKRKKKIIDYRFGVPLKKKKSKVKRKKCKK